MQHSCPYSYFTFNCDELQAQNKHLPDDGLPSTEYHSLLRAGERAAKAKQVQTEGYPIPSLPEQIICYRSRDWFRKNHPLIVSSRSNLSESTRSNLSESTEDEKRSSCSRRKDCALNVLMNGKQGEIGKCDYYDLRGITAQRCSVNWFCGGCESNPMMHHECYFHDHEVTQGLKLKTLSWVNEAREVVKLLKKGPKPKALRRRCYGKFPNPANADHSLAPTSPPPKRKATTKKKQHCILI